MSKNKTVSLVFPAFNEEANIKEAIKAFKKTGLFSEIIVVDNNSRDKTAKIAKKAGAKVISEPRQGYGFAIRCGLGKASGDLIMLSEPDGTFFPDNAKKLLELADKFDVVLGTRTNPKYIKSGANMTFFLRLGNLALAKLIQVLFRTPSISDCGCTYRVITKKIARQLLPLFTVGGSHFLPELVILASRFTSRIIETPVHYGPRVGQSKITGSPIKSVIVGLKMLHLCARLYSR